MWEIITVGLDLARNVFQGHGTDAAGRAVLRKKLRRSQVLEFFNQLPVCVVAVEVRGGAHFWGREIGKLSRDMLLIPAACVKPFVKRRKNDAADAEAICEAPYDALLAGGTQRLGATTKMGERSLRRLLIIGANSVIIKWHVHREAQPGTGLGDLLSRKPAMLVRLALAKKMAWTVWTLMARGRRIPVSGRGGTSRRRSRERRSTGGQGAVWRNSRSAMPRSRPALR